MLIPISTLVLIILFLGIINHRKRKLHMTLMSTAFILDLALVLYIEMTRHAVEQAIEGVEGLLLFHICVSVTVVLLYIALIVLGFQWLKNNPKAAFWHKNLAYVFVVGRLINYVTSFFIGS